MAYIGKIPAAAAITASDLDPAVITGQTALATSPADTDEFLISDAGTLKRIDASLVGGAGVFESQLLHVRDEKTASTNAGTATGGQFTKRTLNTVKTNEISGASLSSDQITLPAGTYYMFGLAPANRCNGHKTRLRNVTDSSTAIVGLNTHTSSGQDIDDDKAFCIGRFTISGQKVFEFQHYVTTTRSTDGFGIASTASAGEVAVYADVQIWKVA